MSEHDAFLLEYPRKNCRIGSSGLNLTCEGLLLGMQAKGHRDSKTVAHPQLRILMNLHSETKDHTHTHSFLLSGPSHRDRALVWAKGQIKGHPRSGCLQVVKEARLEVTRVQEVPPVGDVGGWTRVAFSIVGHGNICSSQRTVMTP
jgi:hypothetical protein